MRKNGFTLAEVLVTLGIIGIVAALTLPALIHDYQKKAWATSLKKNYSLVQNACRMMLANDGADNIAQTEFAKALYYGDYDKFVEEGKKYFSNAKFTNTKPAWSKLVSQKGENFSNIDSKYTISLPSTDIGVSGYTSGSGFLEFTLDVNGVSKNPNKVGADVFRISLENNCKTVLYHYMTYENLLTGNNTSCDTTHSNAVDTCFQAVMRDNWEIKYDISNRSNTSGS